MMVAYAEDFVRARQRICGVYRTGLSVMCGPIPPVRWLYGYKSCTGPGSHLLLVGHPAERDICDIRATWRNLLCNTASKLLAEVAPLSLFGQPSARHTPPSDSPSSEPSALLTPISKNYCSKPLALQTWTTVQPSASVNCVGDWPSASPLRNTDPCPQPSAGRNCPPSVQGSVPQHTTKKLRLPASLNSLQTTIFTLEGPLNITMKAMD